MKAMLRFLTVYSVLFISFFLLVSPACGGSSGGDDDYGLEGPSDLTGCERIEKINCDCAAKSNAVKEDRDSCDGIKEMNSDPDQAAEALEEARKGWPEESFDTIDDFCDWYFEYAKKVLEEEGLTSFCVGDYLENSQNNTSDGLGDKQNSVKFPNPGDPCIAEGAYSCMSDRSTVLKCDYVGTGNQRGLAWTIFDSCQESGDDDPGQICVISVAGDYPGLRSECVDLDNLCGGDEGEDCEYNPEYDIWTKNDLNGDYITDDDDDYAVGDDDNDTVIDNDDAAADDDTATSAGCQSDNDCEAGSRCVGGVCGISCSYTNDGVEICDGQDNDCDGEIDEDVLNACGGCGEVPEETCDGIDNDCNGAVDDRVDGDSVCDQDPIPVTGCQSDSDCKAGYVCAVDGACIVPPDAFPQCQYPLGACKCRDELCCNAGCDPLDNQCSNRCRKDYQGNDCIMCWGEYITCYQDYGCILPDNQMIDDACVIEHCPQLENECFCGTLPQ